MLKYLYELGRKAAVRGWVSYLICLCLNVMHFAAVVKFKFVLGNSVFFQKKSEITKCLRCEIQRVAGKRGIIFLFTLVGQE